MEGSHFKNYFGKLKLALRALGVSLSENESVGYRIYSWFIFILIASFVVFNLLEIFKHDFSAFVDTIVYTFGMIVTIFKMMLVLRYREEFRHIFKKLEEEPFALNLERGGQVEEELISECLQITNFQNLIFWIMGTVTIVVGSIYSIIKRLQNSDYNELPFGPLTFLNITNSPSFEITWLYQSLNMYHLAMMFCTVDLLLGGILAHLSYQFKMSQNNFERLVTIGYNIMLKNTNNGLNQGFLEKSILSEEIDGSKIPWKFLKQALIEAVDYHLAITKLAQKIEDIFSVFQLFICMGSLIIMGLLILLSSQFPLNDARLPLAVVEIIGACMHVLTFCYWGQEMISQSQQVGCAAYEADFVGTDTRFQKSLILVMRRGLKPSVLTAGKFAPIGLTTFIWIMRSGYSAFMVLRNSNSQTN